MLTIPCHVCVSSFLEKETPITELDVDLFFCCSNCHQDHVRLKHADSSFQKISRQIMTMDPESIVLKERVDHYFNVVCFACKNYFSDAKNRLLHDEACFMRFAGLSEKYGETLVSSYLSSPFIRQKNEEQEKAALKKQLVLFTNDYATAAYLTEDAPPVSDLLQTGLLPSPSSRPPPSRTVASANSNDNNHDIDNYNDFDVDLTTDSDFYEKYWTARISKKQPDYSSSSPEDDADWHTTSEDDHISHPSSLATAAARRKCKTRVVKTLKSSKRNC